MILPQDVTILIRELTRDRAMNPVYRRNLAISTTAERNSLPQHLFAAVLALIALAIGVLFAAGPARASAETEAFIQQTIDDGYQILNSATLGGAERSTAFREFMLSLTDMERIARFTLGPYVNRASEAEVNAFVGAFTNYAVTVYEDRLSRYTGQTMRVTDSQDAADRAELDSVVNATVVDTNNPNAATYKVGFRVRQGRNQPHIITDMQVEGVWLALSQRADFTSFLQQNNGSVPALSNSLERQAAQIRLGSN
jgi:phospholipid transport system substrate-binding protein